MKTELTIEESLKREKGMIFPQDFSEKTLLAVAHSRNCIEALEKQIPKAVHNIYPTEIEETGTHILTGDCPVCGSPVPAEQRYCWSCGQRLEWTY